MGGEGKIITGMGDGFKAEEHPWCQHYHRKDLHDRRGVELEGGRKALCAGFFKQRGKQQHHGEEENYGKEGVQVFFETAAVSGEQAKSHDDQPGGGNLTEVDIKVGDGVEIPPRENIAEQEPGQQDIGRGIGPEDGKIGDNEYPGSQKSVVVP